MADSKETTQPRKSVSGAIWVAAGILLSRLAGLVRERAFAHYLGNSDASDAFKAALRIPNFLQNLLGEGVLSASLIPVYAGLRAQGKHEEADKVIRIMGSLLFVLTSVLCALGMVLSPWLIAVVAPGFSGEKAQLTIRLVQIFFPGVGLLVMSAWCLGVLNSHKKFFLSYVAPVVWNLAIIASLLVWGSKVGGYDLAIIAAWGLVSGSFLQFAVQIPSVAKLLIHLKPEISFSLAPVKTIFKNFVPVVFSRGVVQLSAFIDSMLASFLPTGAVSALAYAQTIYLLPVSLFGMAVSAAALPSMSEVQGKTEEINLYLSAQLKSGLEQIAFFVVPTCVVFIFFGDLIVGALFQSGAFDRESTVYVWGILVGATVGLLAGTQGRLYSSVFYSLKDTRTPLKFAIVRVVLTTVLGYYCSLQLPGILGVESRWGAVGLTASAGLAAWIEFLLLRRALEKRIGTARLAFKRIALLFAASEVALIPAQILRYFVFAHYHVIVVAAGVLGLFGVIYLAMTIKLKIPQARNLIQTRLRR